ncbi:hypothetical protein SAMN05216355_103152 [Actinomyces ruminicola]|uniref:Uncharacterized protein n=1 Tax=Actinomyces ruminicola TaxID=332524 RepID=A0A1H0B9H6_9ACTO|nr:hypothetical protein [Actinomyces ruminicola]SDN42289.1 hypothetical protein SAMN05216355_103152 [Actinomyces ruminicola]
MLTIVPTTTPEANTIRTIAEPTNTTLKDQAAKQTAHNAHAADSRLHTPLGARTVKLPLS